MKILIVTQYFWPENFRINDLCNGLSQRGHEVTILTGEPNYPLGEIFPEYVADKRSYASYHGCKVLRAPIFARGKSKISLLLNYASFPISASIIALKNLRKKHFDIVFICQLSPPTVAIPGILMSWQTKAPLVMWVLDLWPEALSSFGFSKNSSITRFIRFLMVQLYKRCDLIVAQSKGMRDNLRLATNELSKVAYIPTWAETQFRSSSSMLTSKHNNEVILTFAGNIGVAQDVDTIINAAALLRSSPNIRFQIIGDGRDASRIQRLIKGEGLEKNVFLLGRYPLEKMPEVFNNSDALLITLGKGDAFQMTVPGKLQSYLAAGRPIIGAIDGEACHVIREANCGYCVSSGDSVGFANAIKKLSALKISERNSLGLNGQRYFESNYSRDIVLDEFENQLSMLLAQ